MLIDVASPIRNLVLNGCFYTLLLLALISCVPWGRLGAHRVSRLLRWLPVSAVGVAFAYEMAMPARFDIRLDLVLLVPVYGLILLTWTVRWFGWRRRGFPLRDAS